MAAYSPVGTTSSGATFGVSSNPGGFATITPGATTSLNNIGSSPSSAGAGKSSSYAVVTAQPAAGTIGDIQNDYQNNIAPGIANQATNNANKAQLPVITGYNVSATPTGAQGETKATNNSTGGEYYITPQKPPQQPASANDIIAGLNGVGPAATGAQNPASTIPTTGNPSVDTSLQNYTNTQGQIDKDSQDAYDTFQQVTQQYENGAIPLNAAQQGLLDTTKNAYAAMLASAGLKGDAAAALNHDMTDGLGVLSNIQNNESYAVAKLTQGFEDSNYKAISDAYTDFKDLQTQKTTSLKNLSDTIATAQQNAIANQQKEQELAETAKQNAIEDKIALSGTWTAETDPNTGNQYLLNNKTGAIEPAGSGGGSSVSPIVSQNTQTTDSGIQYVDSSSMTTAEQTQASKNAATNGLVFLGPKGSAAVQKIDDVRANLGDISDSLNGILPKDATGRVLGGALGNKLSAYLQSSDQTASFSTWRSAAIGVLQALAGGQGSGLRINQSEIALSVANDIPNITDTVGVAQAKLAKVNAMLDNQERSIFGTKVWDAAHPDSPSAQAGSTLNSMFGLGSSTGTPSAPNAAISSAFSFLGAPSDTTASTSQ